MKDYCEACGIEFSASVKRNHISGHQLCDSCKKKLDTTLGIVEAIEKIKTEGAISKENEKIDMLKKQELKRDFISTSGFNFEGYKIVKYLNVTSGEVVLGTGFFSEIDASTSDFFGSSSYKLEDKINKAKEEALDKLIENSIKRGANAVIGVDLDYMTMKNDMIVACANGTAVIIEKIDNK